MLLPAALVRQRRFVADDDICATLTYYPPGTWQAPHAHDFVQFSFVLAGEMLEMIGRRDFEVGGAAIGSKPAGCDHSDRFGSHGTLIFAVNLGPDQSRSLGLDTRAGWTPILDRMAVARLVRAAVASPDKASRAEVLQDLVGLSGDREPIASAEPPSWLQRVREEIREGAEPARITALATAAGVHRTRLSRLFRHHYRTPPSVYRRDCMAAKALSAALSSESRLTDIAYDVGFADQSHLARTLKANTGLPLSHVKALLD